MYFFGDFIGAKPGQLEIVSGFLLIYGFFTGIILGQTYKTLPFIIWLFHYQKLVGKQKTPLPAELYNDTFIEIHTWTFITSVIFFVTGIILSLKYLVLTGSILILLTSITYSYNTTKMIFHKKI